MPSSETPVLFGLRRILLSVAGLGLIAASLMWDVVRGADTLQFGRLQIAGCLAGAAMLAMGLLFRQAHRYGVSFLLSLGPYGLQVLRWAAVLVLVVTATSLALQLPEHRLFAAAAWILWCYAAALCLLLSMRFGWLLLAALASLSLLLEVINTFKAGLTGLPLTMLDIKIAAANPAGLWDALHLPAWTLYAAIAGIALASLYLLHEGVTEARRVLGKGNPRQLAFRIAPQMIGIAVTGLLATAYLDRLFDKLGAYSDTWDTVGVTAMADEIGVLPYLAYSQRIEASRTGDFFRRSIGSDPPSKAEVRDAVLRHLDFESASAGATSQLPNVVFLLAESTFDPNAAFRLDQNVHSSLFEPNESTVAEGPLIVNVIGGGSWVTEFETIVGLDSRLFGYSGYYTHSSLSPYVSRSFVTHLESKGYRSSAFFPHWGRFYNYRNAYKAYGVDAIYDSLDLGHPDDWMGTDTQVIDDFTRIMGPNPAGPFLSYVLLIENHGPHQCRSSSIGQVAVHFTGNAEFEPNCLLHEYLRRLASTEAAVSSLVDYLRRIEARDGRPFVLLVFGDHQPYSFTGDEWTRVNFDRLRTAAGMNVTFFHLMSSAGNRLKCCLREIPATLLPTLVSAYAAEGPDDVYLGVNLWLYERCGPDAIASGPLAGLFRESQNAAPGGGGGASRTDHRSETCKSAYSSALTAYRESGIIKTAPAPNH